MNRASLDNLVESAVPPRKIRGRMYFNPFIWDAKTFFKVFFYLEMASCLTVFLLAVLIYFYRPVDVIYTCIFAASNAIVTFVIYKIYRASANRGEVLFHYFILKFVLNLVIIGFSMYQLITFSRISLNLVVGISRILKFQFIFYVLLLVMGSISAAFAVFVIVVQFPKRNVQEQEKVISLNDQRNLEGMLKLMSLRGEPRGDFDNLFVSYERPT